MRFTIGGESADPALRNLEQRHRYPDAPGLEHVLIAEAERGELDPARRAALPADASENFLGPLRG